VNIMMSVRLQSAKALRAATFTFALVLGAGLTGCADAGPDEEADEAYEGESEELAEGEQDPQAIIIVGASRDTDPGKRFGGFPRIGSITRTNHSGSGSSTDRTVRTGGSSSSTGRTVSTGGSSSSTGRTVSTGSSSSGGRTVTIGGGTVIRR
jgi:hypothetical protein